jgi:hypothetical protein
MKNLYNYSGVPKESVDTADVSKGWVNEVEP